ncbi:hypothetical protein BH24GEM1_BH24GEM1_07160 [soil metagenome]
MERRAGFTLVETLIVVVLLGLIVLVGYPKMSSAMLRNDVRSARTAMVNLVAKARTGATQGNRRTWIRFQGNSAYVIARPRRLPGAGDADTLGTVENFAAAYGVAVSATVDSIQFDPRGIGTGFGSSATIQVSHGSYSDAITVDALGRVTK